MILERNLYDLGWKDLVVFWFRGRGRVVRSDFSGWGLGDWGEE